MKKTILLLVFIILFFQGVKSQKNLKVNIGHSGEVNSVAFSPNNKYIVSGGEDNTIKLWNIQTKQVIRTFSGHADWVLSAKFSPDGKYIASASGDKTIKIWDIYDSKEIKTFSGHSNCVESIDFSPDGKYIISSSSNGIIIIYDIQTDKSIIEFKAHGDEIENVSFSPNGKYFATASGDNNIKIWDFNDVFIQQEENKKNYNKKDNIVNNNIPDTTSGFTNYIKAFRIFKGHTKDVTSIVFSSNSKYIFSGSLDGKIKQWDISNGIAIKSFVINSDIYSLACSSDDKYIFAGCGNKTIQQWNINQGIKINEFTGFNYKTLGLDISADDKYLVSGNWGEISLLNIDDNKNSSLFKGNSNMVLNVDFSNDGKNIITQNSNNVNKLNTIWDIKNITKNRIFNSINTNSNNTLCFNSHNNNIAYANLDTIVIVDNLTGQEINRLIEQSNISSIAIKPDGKFIVSGYRDGEIIMQDIKTGEIIKTFNNKNTVDKIVFSNKGNYLVSGSFFDKMKLWNVQTGEFIREIPAPSESFAFSPDDKYLVSCIYSSIVIWDIETGKEIRNIKDEGANVRSVAFSPDGNYIVSASNKNVTLWNFKSGNKIRTFTGHNSYVKSVSFSPDGNYIVSGSYDCTSKIWETETGTQLASLISISNSSDYIVVAPNGRFDGTEEGMKMLYFVDGLDIIPLSSLYEQYYTPNLLARILAGEKFEPPQININELTLPPLVEITSPTEQGDLRGFKPLNTGGLKSPSQQIEVIVQATDQDGGIDEICLFVNGKLVETTQRGFKPVVQNNQTKTKTFTISLSNGKNIIKTTAFNNQRTESIADEIIVYYEGAKATSDLYLFVIGIDKYRNPDMNLNYAVADATGFKDAIVGNTSTIFGSVNTSFITNESATKEKILAEFEIIKAKMKQEDVLIFYYAGHGAMSIEDNPLYYLVLYDVHQLYGNNDLLNNKALSVEEIKNICMELPAQKQLFVLDACQSGGVEKAVMRGNAEQKAIAVLSRATGTYWLTASGTDEYATEFDQLGHGVFTYAILQGLKGEADGGNKDKQITVKELDFYIQDKVPELSEKYKGQPQFPKSYGGGDDFPLIIIK